MIIFHSLTNVINDLKTETLEIGEYLEFCCYSVRNIDFRTRIMGFDRTLIRCGYCLITMRSHFHGYYKLVALRYPNKTQEYRYA